MDKGRFRSGGKMKILVTGANGYIGQGVVKKLLNKGVEVIATDICFDADYDKRAEKIECNLFDVENPYKAFGEPDVLFHLAWRDGFRHNSENHMKDLYGHYSFIEKMTKGGVSRISVMGTMHEIGFYEGEVDEDTPTNPMSLYGISKNALRQAVEQLCKTEDLKYQWLRGFYIVGNAEKGKSIFSKIAEAEERGDTKFPFTSGRNEYDFIDYDEFCEQIALSLNQDRITGIINICSGTHESLSSRVERFIKDNNYCIKLDYGKYPDRPYDSKAIWGNNEKIKKIIDNKNE